jgi:hypothetical protein
MKGRTAWIALALILCAGQSAYALEMVERDRIFIYYPPAEFKIAANLLNACEPIASFLDQHGLPIARPLHIILDDTLDRPMVQVEMMPHREIRIPIRAPGVLEDGSNEANPWHYFLFKGLCAQGIFSARGGIPGRLHTLFGEIISPNLILPEWGIDGIGHLLYEKYQQRLVPDPMANCIFDAGPIPNFDKVSNHPDVWPGRFTHRIYGRPFLRWLDQRYGWEKVLAVLRLHGQGIIPIEIDHDARVVFGQSWSQLWQSFRDEHATMIGDHWGMPVVGYWHDPFIYWNDNGVYPGLRQNGVRGRYGYLDASGWLMFSEYDAKGISVIRSLRAGTLQSKTRDHFWDPGPGGVAVTRQGRIPLLVVSSSPHSADGNFLAAEGDKEVQRIEAPPGVIQLSGPVADNLGRIAVAGNSNGNWDIWFYDGSWHRITTAPSIEMDPWLEEQRLIFASNASGRFQIHAHDMQQLTETPTAAILPRQGSYLQLDAGGWRPLPLTTTDLPLLPSALPSAPPEAPAEEAVEEASRDYSPFKSIWPNYVLPDIYFDTDNFQFGVATEARDVTGKYTWDTGMRYSVDDALFSWRLGGSAHDWSARVTRYPFGYTSRDTEVDEIRHDFKLGWLPFHREDLEISANWRLYAQNNDDRLSEDESWGSISHRHSFNHWRTLATIDLFAEGSQSIYGELSYRFGKNVHTVLRLQGGKTWGDWLPGHNTFRVGGNTGEGFFTQRPTRLFPLRGFETNALDSGQAATGSMEIYWPLARLQTGYKTLPLFLRNISVGTFMDSGFATQTLSHEELLLSAGFELITGMELAWGFNADFRLGLAWPLKHPDSLEADGPLFLIQIGRPL